MRKILLALLSFFIGLVVFMPKESLFSTLKSLLKKEHIEIVSKDITDRFVDMKIDEPLLVYDGIESVEAKSISIKPWLLYNRVDLKDISPAPALKGVLNIKADDMTITQSIIDPKVAKVDASGRFGTIEGYIDLKKRVVRLILTPAKSFENSKIVRDYFKKSKEGLVYESNF